LLIASLHDQKINLSINCKYSFNDILKEACPSVYQEFVDDSYAAHDKYAYLAGLNINSKVNRMERIKRETEDEQPTMRYDETMLEFWKRKNKYYKNHQDKCSHGSINYPVEGSPYCNTCGKTLTAQEIKECNDNY